MNQLDYQKKVLREDLDIEQTKSPGRNDQQRTFILEDVEKKSFDIEVNAQVYKYLPKKSRRLLKGGY